MSYRLFSGVICFSAICAMFAFSPGNCYSDITMNIWDNGTNLFMTATGSYDLTNATPNNSTHLGANASVWANFTLGWETGFGTTQGYAATYTGILTFSSSQFGATSTTTTNPFFFFHGNNSIQFNTGSPLNGSVNESAVFNGITLASLGMLPGETVTVSWGAGGANERGSINTLAAVPEPSAAMFGFGVVGLLLARRRTR